MITRFKMKPELIRIVYMGTPGFAVAPLRQIIGAGYQVVAVVTAPDRPAGRGKKVSQPAVKQYITGQHPDMLVLQPENLKDQQFIRQLESLRPDIQVVVAFRMLPEAVWRIPRLGTFNLHASLLPQYRGAAPIHHAIINGETETGVTTFLIDQQIDTGNILLQEKVNIGARETAGELHDRLMATGADLVIRTAKGLAEGTLEARSQDQMTPPDEALKKAPKIHKEDCRIEWSLQGRSIVNLIRGLSPYPGAFTTLDRGGSGQPIYKIYKASFQQTMQPHQPGTLITDGKKYLQVAVIDGTLSVESIQMEGKRRMGIAEFLAGTRIISGQYRFS
jgi:methionyl-tRNA formyltransferase